MLDAGRLRRRRAIHACAVLVAAGTGCYPGELTDAGDSDLVATYWDSAAAFDAFATYALPDSIVRLGSGGTGLSDPDVDRQILDAVATELTALGYSRLNPGATGRPDVVVTVSVNLTEGASWAHADWWADWSWYPGWAGWYPEWGQGWSPGYSWSEARSGVRPSGTVQITILDANRPGGSAQTIPAAWVGVIDRFFESDATSVMSRFQALIRQAFDQSPYL